jgi:hypothetical protein
MARRAGSGGRRAALAAATAAAVLLLSVRPAAAQAGDPQAALADQQAIEQSLDALYAPEPGDVEQAMARLEAVRLRRAKDMRIEAGLAMGSAILGARRGDQALVEKSVHRAELAVSQNQSRMVEAALGLTSLLAGRMEQRKRERERHLASAVRAFEAAAASAIGGGAGRWLDLYWKALALRELGKAEEATRALRDATSITPSAFGAFVYGALGRTLAERGALREALDAFAAARALATTHTAVALEVADSLVRLGEYEKALAALEESAAGDERAAELRARIEIALGKPVPGPGGAQSLIDARAGAADAPAELLALRAELRRLAGDAAGAAADATAAMKRSSLVPLALATLAELALAQGATETALARAQAAAGLDPREPGRLDLLARALGQAGDREGAAAATRRKEALEAAIAAARADGRELRARTLELAAAARLDENRYEETLDLAEKLLKEDPTDGAALLLKLRAALGAGRAGDARSAAKALTGRFPDLHDLHALAAEAAQLEGDRGAARAAAEAALKLEPSDARALKLVGAGAGEEVHLPPELEEAAAQLGSPDPLTRAAGAERLMAHPDGMNVVLRHLERETDPFVVGAIAKALGIRHEKRAVPALCRHLETLPPSQVIARARVIRALGRIGDPAALARVLEAALSGEAEIDAAGASAVGTIVGNLDEGAAIRFQRELLESQSEVRRALAPVYADKILASSVAREEARGDPAREVIRWARVGLVAALALALVLRYRLFLRQARLATLARAARKRGSSASWDDLG